MVLLLALVGCQRGTGGLGGALDPTAEPIQAYRCGEILVETRVDGRNVALTLPDRVLTLAPAVSASGARFADRRGNEFWSKGGESALLTLAGGTRMGGRATASRSPWAAARERGVASRAVGQEPGWAAEVDTGERAAGNASRPR